MNTETTEVSNDAPEADNISNSLLSETAPVETVQEPTETVEAGEYDHIPSKFMGEDGQPDYEKLANSYSELEKKIGSKLGAESIDEYEYEWKSETDFEGDEGYDKVKESMFELGLSKEQFSGIMNMFEGNTTAVIEQLTPTPERAKETLTEAWGNDYDSNMVDARTAWDSFATEGMDIEQIGNNPTIIQFLANIGSQLGEDVRPPLSNSSASRITEAEVDELIKSPDYYDDSAGGREKRGKVEAFYNT